MKDALEYRRVARGVVCLSRDANPEDCFAGGGKAGDILRTIDWAQRPVGPMELWPQSLRTACIPLTKHDSEVDVWPLSTVVETGTAVEVRGLTERLGPLPGGPWPEPSHTALVVPLARPGQATPYGFLVAGISPRRTLDSDYESFLTLVAGPGAAPGDLSQWSPAAALGQYAARLLPD